MTSTALAEQQLSTAMREGSEAEHDAAENSDFTVELLAGRINAAGYTAYLQRLHTVYVALEDAISARRSDPAVAAVYDPAVERRAALEADLDHWAPGAPYDTDSPAATEYAERLRSRDWGGDLLAHHYTRYLGDLSGGQAIGRILERSFDLDGAGTAFYAFPDIAKPKPYKDAYRTRLDELDLSPADKARVVDEVKVAFNLNQALFDELGENLAAYVR
ncbi:putative heme oxygenase [Mycolicibacterium chitae]|uniref:Heme oxygenase n=1 Tax=Mycolicibacterium chitae TaxID=1792 RepID=A0A3S4RCT9_MYCCI|nr:putative heme oxygenase [Mycolicibacterium chitae]VEG47360.1 heme oxygenase [Mycolicibacterium chitae]